MIKRIRRDQLKLGMYIHDLNCSWVDHPFLLNSLKVEDEKALAKIAEIGVKELFIDTDKGLDVIDAQPAEVYRAEVHREFHEKTADALRAGSNPAPAVPLKEEIANARVVHDDANHIVHKVLSDVRLGKPVEVEKVEPVVERITDSLFRNRDALISLSRLKNKNLLHPTVRIIFDMNSCRYLPPQDIDFSRAGGGRLADQIVGHESPQRRGIDPYAYL